MTFVLCARGPGGKPEILFDVADAIINHVEPSTSAPVKVDKNDKKDKNNVVPISKPKVAMKIPKEHRFAISDIPRQRLAIFSHSKGLLNLILNH